MFINEEISCVWKPEEKKEKKSPLEKGYRSSLRKKSSDKVYNGKNRKRSIK
jgi:hypothetical protein